MRHDPEWPVKIARFDPASIEQLDNVGREVLDAVTAIRLVGIPVPALRDGDGVYGAR